MKENDFRFFEIEDSYFDFQLLPQFIHVGRVKTNKAWRYESHLHNNHEWLLNRKGKVRCWINNYEFTARSGTIYFIQPGQNHKQISDGGETDHWSIRFHLFDAAGHEICLFPTTGDPQHQVLQDRNKQFAGFVERIYKEVWKQKQGWKQIVEAIIIEMIWYVRRKLQLFPMTTENGSISLHHKNVVEQAKHYLQLNLNRQVDLKELANYCCMSYYHIGRIFKDMTGMTPLQYTQSLRITEAQTLLIESSMTVYSIAEAIGFNDAAYFTRQFKKMVGVTPKDYRLKSSGTTTKWEFPKVLD